MKRKFTIIAVPVAILVLVGAALLYWKANCPKEPQSDPVIPYVRGIIDGTFKEEQKMLRSFGAPRVSDALFVVGPRERCEALSLAIMASDDFDNVDARLIPDYLPDFAGETICSIRNFDDFAALAEESGQERLRELTVRNVLAAVDTLCYISPYDRSGLGRKPLAKLVVLASPYMCGYGAADVDSLLHATVCPLPIINPLGEMASSIYSRPVQQALTIGVMADASADGCGAYESCLRKVAAATKSPAPACFVHSCEAEGDPLISFLDHFIAEGNGGKLDCLIVDDYSVDMDAIRMTLDRLVSGHSPESMTYGNLLAEGFKVLDSRKMTTMACYRKVRELNLFTHNISLPVGVDLMVLPMEDDPRGLMLMQFNQKFIPQE